MLSSSLRFIRPVSLVLAFAMLTTAVWAARGERTLSGNWHGAYTSGALPGAWLTMVFKQQGNEITGAYITQTGMWGTITGKPDGKDYLLQAKQETPGCAGEFVIKAKVDGERMTFAMDGKDCRGEDKSEVLMRREKRIEVSL